MADQYAPKVNVACPTDGTLFRQFSAQNSTLNPSEESFIKARSEKVQEAWKDWINGTDVGYNMSLFQNKFPAVGMGLSGGGARALLLSTSVLNAYDSRNATAKTLGTGGLYNVATWLAGTSGGSWLLPTLGLGNTSATFPELLKSLLLDIDLLDPQGSSSEQSSFNSNIFSAVGAKRKTGMITTLADLWAEFLGHHFLPGTTRDNLFDNSSHGAGQLWSDIARQEALQTASIPLPIAVACSRSGEENAVTSDDVVYEMTPFEFGSFDPSLAAAINMTYVGTSLKEGKPANSSACVTGFDQASFVIATSSDLFDKQNILQTAVNVLNKIFPALNQLDDNGTLQALWPNAFQGINPGKYLDSNTTNLRLDDAGENHDNVPIEQVSVRARGADVLVLVDATDETTNGVKNNFPNGTSLIFASNRLKNQLSANHQQLPPIPDDFAKTGNNLRVSFFGCDPTTSPPDFPLVIYVPNSPPSNGDNPVVNTDTTQLSYTPLHQELFLDQGFSAATSGFIANVTGPDPNFPNCLKCAAIDRARLFVDPVIPRSSECQKCFTQYCFDPQNPPSASEIVGRKFNFVDPNPKSFAQKHVVLIAVLSSVIGFFLILSCCMVTCCCIRRRRRRL